MKLSDIKNGNLSAEWAEKGYELPKFDIEAVKAKTHAEPTWVHFGAGNIFRAFPAAVLNDALNSGKYDRGVIVAESFDYEIIDKAYQPYDNLSLLVCLKSTGEIEKKVIASVTESLKADYSFGADWARLVEIFQNPSLQMISFTITEKGYGVAPADLERGLTPVLAMGKVTALLYERFKAGKLPLTVQSMDNCSHNGDKVKTAVHAYAAKWVEQGLVPAEFLAYVQDDYTEEQAQALQSRIESIDNVATVTFISRQEAKDTYLADIGADNALYSSLPDNVLRDRYSISVTDISQLSDTIASVRQVEGIADISAALDVANGFITVRNVVTIVSIALVAILLIISLFIVSNAIKLATLSRQEEIGIMKMCGATNGFIRMPFVFEGIVLGLASAIIGFACQWGIYELLINAIQSASRMQLVSIVPFIHLAPIVGACFAGVGLIVGVCGSLFTIRKYLQV